MTMEQSTTEKKGNNTNGAGFSNILFEESVDMQTERQTQGATDGSTSNNAPKSNGIPDTNASQHARLLLASTLVDDAIRNRNLQFKTDDKYVRSYNLFNHRAFKLLLYLCIWGNLCLAIFEKPAVVEAPYWATMIPEVLFLAYFLTRLLHNSYFSKHMSFWRDPKNLVILITVIVTLADMVCYIIWVNTSAAESAVRWSRPLRVLFLINFPENRQLRKAFRNIRRTLPDIIHVLVLLLASIAIFSLLLMKLMERRGLKYPNGEDYFTNYWESFWDLYVLVTTANNPDVMMPAYDYSNWLALFYIVYIIVNLYIFMNIVLAVIYSNYKRHLKNEVKASVYLKRRLLSQAFNLLKEENNEINTDTWTQLMKILRPNLSPLHVNLLFYVLDDDGNHRIDEKDFLKAADLLNLELREVQETGTWLENTFPRFYLSRASVFFRQVVLSRYFTWFFDFLIFLNAIFIGLSMEEAEYFFLPAFSLEIIFKLYAMGIKKFLRSFWNIFDLIVISSAILITVIEAGMGNNEGRIVALDFLLVLRVLRLIRLFAAVDRFYIILITIVNIGPSIATYCGVIFVFYYIYAIIGTEIFHGLITYYGYEETEPSQQWCGNPLLQDSEFYGKHYCSNNFNTILSSLVVLFELMVVNQWHIISSGYVLVTSKAARLYFISFHLICVIILLNIFTAFVLEVFILEYTLSKGQLETAVETKIKEMGLGEGQKAIGRIKQDKRELVSNMEGDPTRASPPREPAVASTTTVTVDGANGGATDGANNIQMPWDQDDGRRLRFKLSSKAKDVETLLQLMFEGEILPTDVEGEHMEEQPIKLTLDNFTL